ncbi:MAG: GNAT family N-acetyltransferase [Aggregatilineales bacterium]
MAAHPQRYSHNQNITLVPFRGEASYMQDAIQIYAEVWHKDAYDSGYMLRQYPQFPCFYGVLAQINGYTVGMGFGTAAISGLWWHERVKREVGDNHPVLQKAWILTELAVRPQYQNLHIGSRLLTALTDAQPRRNLLLSTHTDNVAAIRFYQRHGWWTLHPGFAFHRRGKQFAILARQHTH